MGDPMELRIHGYELTLRLADAQQIGVSLLRFPRRKLAERETGKNGKRRQSIRGLVRGQISCQGG